jgi:hypothetical protein
MSTNQSVSDLNPALVGAIATFIGRLTGLQPPPTDAFPPEWQGHLRELVQSIGAIKAGTGTDLLGAAKAVIANGHQHDVGGGDVFISTCDAAEALERAIATVESKDDRPLKPSDAGHRVAALIEELESRGIFATVERVSVPPFAMGNHVARVKTWRKRERAE